jgi:hypothetical protein
MNAFRTVTVRDVATGETFPHTNYTASDDEAVALARLTFVSNRWQIVPPNRPTVSLPPRTVPFQQTTLF